MKKLIYIFLLFVIVSCTSEIQSTHEGNNTNNTVVETQGTILNIMDDDTSTLIATVAGNNIRYAPFRTYLRYTMEIDPDTIPVEFVQGILETWLSREAVYNLGVKEGLDKDSLYLYMEFETSRDIISQMVLERITLSIQGATEAEIREAYNKWKNEIKYERTIAIYQFLSESNAFDAISMIEEGMDDTLIVGLVGLDTVENIRRLYSQIPILEEAVANMKVDEITEPFSIGEGYIVAKIIKENYIESPIAPYEQLRPTIMLYLTELNQFKYMTNFVDTLIDNSVEIFTDSLKIRAGE